MCAGTGNLNPELSRSSNREALSKEKYCSPGTVGKTRIKWPLSQQGDLLSGVQGSPTAQSFISECGYFLGETNFKVGEKFVYYMRFYRLE